ncbi:MAG: GH92 family glycosyl hydrolase [Flavobacteriales bacterium]|nr:GH92 family glycosyl hydrolase [Flavobacteriales bacterium]
MRSTLFFTSVLILFAAFAQAQYQKINIASGQDLSNYRKTSAEALHVASSLATDHIFSDLVEPFVGTAGHGHTFPGATTPFGMVQISPDNGVQGWDWCSGYHWASPDIVFFSHKHLSGTGASDQGDIGFMPFMGEYQFRHTFNHENEFARPGYYAVKLDNGILCEFTATPRCAIHRYTFPEGALKNLKVDLTHNVSFNLNKKTDLEWLSDSTFGGLKQSLGWARNQRCYFAAQTSEGFDRKQEAGTATLTFNGNATVLEIRVGLSTVSVANAQENLKAEVGSRSFDEVRAEAETVWETELSKIAVEASPEIKTTFYSALYHSMIAPNLLSDVNGEFSDPDGTVVKAVGYDRYSTFSLWDTYRAAHSLFVLVRPDLVDDFVNSMLASYDFRGKLPIWELEANETFCMIGNHSIPVISEAWNKNIRGFDGEKALKACIETADQDSRGLKQYIKLGYVSYGDEAESVSKSLEYAYNDWAVAKFAEALGKKDVMSKYYARSGNYKNLFDSGTGLMRPKNSSGKWLPNFDQFAHRSGVKKHYTEGNAWQYTWSVQHDPAGLAALYGSKAAFERQLDSLFVLEPKSIKHQQQDVTGLIGQYAHGNEPSHHTAYLYNYSEHPWKTQEMVRRICKQFYTEKPDGLCGNEDCGQMSAWYIFSSLGFYPLDPVCGWYELGSPLIARAELHLVNGKTFTFSTVDQSEENVFVQRMELNGKELSEHRISHEQIMSGGELKFFMGQKPME